MNRRAVADGLNDATVGGWQPCASRENLHRRAGLNGTIRQFMTERGVLEVETPMLSAAAVTDPALVSWQVGPDDRHFYLQTSPEFPMKRLLAAGSGPIHQIARVFRAAERGARHHPEFTLLEWYRPGFAMTDMLDEIDALLRVLDLPAAERRPYADVFQQTTGLDPHSATTDDMLELARSRGLVGRDHRRAELLDFLFADCVQPALQIPRCQVVHDFPLEQAALARIRRDAGTAPVAERFELFVDAIEIGNGFNELCDAAEQRARFEADQQERERRGLAPVPVDENLLAALAAGLPACCGMAIGLDRLLMILAGCRHIDEVLAFPIERA